VRGFPGIAILACASAVAALGAAGPAGGSESPSAVRAGATSAQVIGFASELLGLINTFRASHGLAPLTLVQPLVLLATQHSEDMLARGYFGHDSPDGTTFDKRVGGFLRAEGYKNPSVSENIDTGAGALVPKAVFDEWLSPGHVENMLAKDAKQIGIGTAQVPVGVGEYEGQSNPYTVTAIFGPSQPELRVSVLVTWIRGVVRVREPGEKTARQLKGTALVKSGSEIETSAGRVRLTSAADDLGHVQTADFYEGRFVAAYADNFPTLIPPPIVTTVTLSGPLSGCAARKTARHLALLSKPQPKPRPKRHLWGSGQGHFRSDGKYVAATVTGTIWLTEDTCTSTLVRVQSGVVDVYDSVLRKHVTVRTGQSYTARTR
jgi:uncharacterized protein YkwD